jgi:hypothetical protein
LGALRSVSPTNFQALSDEALQRLDVLNPGVVEVEHLQRGEALQRLDVLDPGEAEVERLQRGEALQRLDVRKVVRIKELMF